MMEEKILNEAIEKCLAGELTISELLDVLDIAQALIA
jgi:hypothetical protein